MKTNMVSIASLAMLAAGLALPAVAQNYHLLKELPMRDGGTWTTMAVDDSGRRLYAAHGSRIEAINLNNDVPVGAITDTPDVRGFALAPGFHLGFATSGKSSSASLIDLNNLRTTTKMKTGANPSAIVYEPSKLQLFVCNRGDHSVTEAEADDGDFLATIELGGVPACALADAVVHDAKNARVLVSLEDKNEVVAIDVATQKVTERWPVAPGQSPRGLAYDAANHCLFVACSNQLVAMDTATGKVAASQPISGTGDLAWDASSQTVFCANNDGTVAVIHADSPAKLSVVQTLKAKRGTTAMAVDIKTHKLYVGTADYLTSNNEPAQGGNLVPGSLKIAVYGQ